LNRATLVNLSQNSVLGGTGGSSWVEVTDADGGSIVANAIDSSGCNVGAGTGLADFKAAIKMRGCRRVLVSTNSITGTAAGGYNGFGILSGDSARPAGSNFVHGNAVSAPYNGARYGSHDRYINVSRADVLGANYSARAADAGSTARNAVTQESTEGRPVAVPHPQGGSVTLFVDPGDGSLKARFPNGVVNTLATGA
jgi:hypothetical protein